MPVVGADTRLTDGFEIGLCEHHGNAGSIDGKHFFGSRTRHCDMNRLCFFIHSRLHLQTDEGGFAQTLAYLLIEIKLGRGTGHGGGSPLLGMTVVHQGRRIFIVKEPLPIPMERSGKRVSIVAHMILHSVQSSVKLRLLHGIVHIASHTWAIDTFLRGELL